MKCSLVEVLLIDEASEDEGSSDSSPLELLSLSSKAVTNEPEVRWLRRSGKLRETPSSWLVSLEKLRMLAAAVEVEEVVSLSESIERRRLGRGDRSGGGR